MPDRARSTFCAIALALMPGMALAEVDCLPLPLDYVFCADGTAWPDARRIDMGDGVAFEAGDLWLEVFAVPEDLPADMPLMDLLVLIQTESAEDEGYAPSELVDRSEFSTPYLTVAALTQRVDMGGGAMEHMVVMLAEGARGRIFVSLDPGMDVAADDLFADTQSLVELIRPANGG